MIWKLDSSKYFSSLDGWREKVVELSFIYLLCYNMTFPGVLIFLPGVQMHRIEVRSDKV